MGAGKDEVGELHGVCVGTLSPWIRLFDKGLDVVIEGCHDWSDAGLMDEEGSAGKPEQAWGRCDSSSRDGSSQEQTKRV